MDMDFPLPEELEHLEAKGGYYDDEFEEDFEPPPPEDDADPLSEPQPHQVAKPTIPIPTKPGTITLPPLPLQPHLNPKKRFRPDAPELFGLGKADQLEDKRGRVDDSGKGIEDNLLRYSPPPPVEEPVVDETTISRYASQIDGDFIPVTGLDGERVYAKICRMEREDRLKKLDVKAYYDGLTPEPVNILMQRVEHDAFTKALRASVEVDKDMNVHEIPVVNERLWVDKYAPSSFMELLSDEQTNREVLLWLKQWDSCVFGSDIKSTADDVLSALRRHSSVSQHQNTRRSFGKIKDSRFIKENFRVQNNKDQEDADPKGLNNQWNKKRKGSGPPEQKILLLCGPPGLGKTTLAHVTARHCGYHVVEINASDDRSASTIETKILDVLEMNSVLADSKPKCLVIDEIDGALGNGKGAVEVILKMVSAERKLNSGKENADLQEQSGKKSSKKKPKHASLLRPVICICNDLYVPALRPLRQVAKVHIFAQPTVNRVVSRIKYICSKEGLRTNSIALAALAEYTDCDIRSCLNTLQFLNKKRESLNVMEISSQVVGRKDISKSVFDIWKEIFQKRRVKQERNSINDCNRNSYGFDFLHSLISNRGDYDLIMDGIHENILQLTYHDPLMQKTAKCLHNLGVSDIFHQYTMRTQQMAIQAYLPPLAVTVHRLVSQVGKPNIEWPKSFQRYRTILIEKMDTLRSWQSRISPCISRHLSPKSFAEDLVSTLLHILSPPSLRPVALHLLSEKERNDMAQLVNTMLSYAMIYKNINSGALSSTSRHEVPLDAPLLLFDPPINDFVNFKGYASKHFVLSLAVKQVLVRELEKQNILQGSINNSIRSDDLCNKENPAEKEIDRDRHCKSDYASKKKHLNEINAVNVRPQEVVPLSDSSTSSSKVPAAAADLRPSEKTRKHSRGPSSFFDSFRKASNKGIQDRNRAQSTLTMERDSRPVLFKFNEGFTNAVKRPVRIWELLL